MEPHAFSHDTYLLFNVTMTVIMLYTRVLFFIHVFHHFALRILMMLKLDSAYAFCHNQTKIVYLGNVCRHRTMDSMYIKLQCFKYQIAIELRVLIA